jgi:hypothetical protein
MLLNPSGIEILDPNRDLKRPRIVLPGPRLAVRWKTELCDKEGRVERVLQSGRNMLLDAAMDALATSSLGAQIGSSLQIYSAAFTIKRVLQVGNSVTVAAPAPNNVTITADQGFFSAGDVGRTFQIDNWPELLVTGYTSDTVITCTARGGIWLPGFTPSAGPFSAAGVHYTNQINLQANRITTITTFDTNAANYNTELTDAPNSRFIHQRIWLSAVAVAPWNVLALGWGPNDTPVGITNLAGPDVVPIGKRYRVTAQFFMVYTAIDIAAQTVDWGATIGSFTMAIRSETFYKDSDAGTGYSGNFLAPWQIVPYGTARHSYTTAAVTVQPVRFEGQVGWNQGDAAYYCGNYVDAAPYPTLGAYTNGQFTRTKYLKWTDTVAINNATSFGVANSNLYRLLIIKPSAGTITKPLNYWCDLTFRVFWTRELIN